ncbi:MAG TPA: ribosome small subunit-dependent GTPase A [Treponema sp.]|nr:ribosome small subunit-dependent GTPase A [Treponema sp.]
MNPAGAARGLVIRCSRNSFTVRVEQETQAGEKPDVIFLECNIKGKILKGCEGFYNPLAPGDWVIAAEDSAHPGTGQIISLEKRRNVFSRFNQKGQSPQLLAANVDAALCLTTGASPPFRPRFLDRVLLQADSAGIEPVIVCNKIDLGIDDIDVEERLEDFRRIGYRIFSVSALTGEGIDELRDFINGKCSVLIGQSGVGKSSIINALAPAMNIKTGPINEKYDRGNHTTVMPQMLELPGSEAAETRIIDTPGIRRFVPDGITPGELILRLREFAPLAGLCTYGMSCSHRVEPGCKIMEAVHAGVIHEDRYNSFLRIYDELEHGSR